MELKKVPYSKLPRLTLYRLYGPKVYIEKVRELVNSLRTAGLLIETLDVVYY